MFDKISLIFDKFLWKLSRPISRLLFLSHNIAYKNPFGKKTIVKTSIEYEYNFKSSVELENHSISRNSIFIENPPDLKFINNLAYSLQNVIKKTRNSYIHGFLLYSFLTDYLKNFGNKYSNIRDKVNIVDIGTARGFSALCLAKALKASDFKGNIFTFDILPNRTKFYWNSYKDIVDGRLTRMDLLNDWKDLVEEYLIFFSTASFNSLKVVDIPIIDFAFIDGSHNYNDVMIEINYIVERLNKKAVLIFDDYDVELFPGVVKACNYLISLELHSSFELIKIQNNRQLAIFKFGF